MSGEALARALALSDGWQADVDGDTAWMSYLDPAERILADPGPLLAALAEAGVLREWTTDSPLGPQHRYTTDWTEVPR